MKRKDIPALLAKSIDELEKAIRTLETDIARALVEQTKEKKTSHELSDQKRTLAIMKSAIRSK